MPTVAVRLLVFEQELLDLRQLFRYDTGEVGNVADEFQALLLRVANVDDVLATALAACGRSDRVVQRLCEGDTGAPALFG